MCTKRGVHCHFMSNDYAKFLKIIRNENCLCYTLHKSYTLSEQFGQKKCLSSRTLKIKIREMSINRWCTFSMCEQSLCKVRIYKNKYCWSYRLHKLDTP